MKYILIKGTFHVVGYSPDGDSMMFKAANPKHWAGLEGDSKPLFEEKLNEGEGAVQLRLQGIDALETHYSPPRPRTPSDIRGKETEQQSKPKAGGYHQPAAIGQFATDAFLQIMGVKQTEWRAWGKNTWIDRAEVLHNGERVWVDDKQQDQLTGYIVSSEVEKNGRPISWVFAGDCDIPDGKVIDKDELAKLLPRSVNYILLRKGLVYPYFYSSMAGVLRKKMITATKLGRSLAERKKRYLAKKPEKTPEKVANLWFYDQMEQGVQIPDLQCLVENTELFPYLFRKAAKAWYRQKMEAYWQAVREGKPFTFDPDDTRFKVAGLLDDGNPRIFVQSEQDFARLGDILTIKDDVLTLSHSPMDLVFLA